MSLHVGAILAARNCAARRRKSPPRLRHSAEYISNEQLELYFNERAKGFGGPTSKVELTISCKGLLSTHLIRNNSDPYCVVMMKRAWESRYKEIGRTETIENTHDPNFIRKIIVDYNFEIIQNIRFVIRDQGLKDGYLGLFDTTLSELVTCHQCETVTKLKCEIDSVKYDDCGEITVVTEEVTTCKQIVELQFSAENLPKPSWFSKNKSFLLVSRSNEDATYSVVATTQLMPLASIITWESIIISMTTLCNGDFDRSFKIDCYAHRENGKHKLIGTSYASLSNLNSMYQNQESRQLVNEEKQKNKPGYAPTASLKVAKVNIIDEVTFLDYIRNGTQMHFAVAIDFTASNGVHTDPKSLHYLGENSVNSYELALRGVGETLQKYDQSQLFPAFGFGAKIPPSNQVSFQFALNNNAAAPYCSGIEEIIKHYKDQLNVVELFGPTNFSPVIHEQINIAKQFQDGKHYFVLLIITDGVLSDRRLTKEAIIEASKLPISIIIVGVGDDNFEAMEELDADDVRLSVEGHTAERDIVQFVPLNKFVSKNGPYIESEAKLAEEVLAEIPEQVTSYMIWRGIKPDIKPDPLPTPSHIIPTAPIVPEP